MEFDQTKKIEVEVSENVIAENEVGVRREKKSGVRSFLKKADPLDLALVPVVLGVFISLGFLFAGLLGQSSVSAAVSEVGQAAAAVL